LCIAYLFVAYDVVKDKADVVKDKLTNVVKDKADVVKASIANDKDKANVVKDKTTNVVKDKADVDKEKVDVVKTPVAKDNDKDKAPADVFVNDKASDDVVNEIQVCHKDIATRGSNVNAAKHPTTFSVDVSSVYQYLKRNVCCETLAKHHGGTIYILCFVNGTSFSVDVSSVYGSSVFRW
ncbi:hypothetical protein Tco_1471465, partial [Tanacetum coccineum]